MNGCATSRSIESNFQRINYRDGLDKKEIITLARKALLNSGLNKDYQLNLIEAQDEGAHWRIIFSSVKYDRHACVLILDKKEGAVLAFYEARTPQETYDGRNPRRSTADWKKINKFWKFNKL